MTYNKWSFLLFAAAVTISWRSPQIPAASVVSVISFPCSTGTGSQSVKQQLLLQQSVSSCIEIICRQWVNDHQGRYPCSPNTLFQCDVQKSLLRDFSSTLWPPRVLFPENLFVSTTATCCWSKVRSLNMSM